VLVVDYQNLQMKNSSYIFHKRIYLKDTRFGQFTLGHFLIVPQISSPPKLFRPERGSGTDAAPAGTEQERIGGVSAGSPSGLRTKW